MFGKASAFSFSLTLLYLISYLSAKVGYLINIINNQAMEYQCSRNSHSYCDGNCHELKKALTDGNDCCRQQTNNTQALSYDEAIDGSDFQQDPPINRPPLPIYSRKPLPFAILFLISSIMLAVLVNERMGMQDCQYWGSLYNCYYSDIKGDMCCSYMCPSQWWDSNCKSVVDEQNIMAMISTSAGIGFCAGLSIVSVLLLCMGRRMQRKWRVLLEPNNNGKL